mgnify:CR=1 FL=1
MLKKNISSFGSDFNKKVAALIDYNAAYTTGWLKENAPWHDNTGAARTGLTTMPFHNGNHHELIMAYSVYYGIWLEVAHSGNWAIITPAMRIVGAKIMRDMQLLADTVA